MTSKISRITFVCFYFDLFLNIHRANPCSFVYSSLRYSSGTKKKKLHLAPRVRKKFKFYLFG